MSGGSRQCVRVRMWVHVAVRQKGRDAAGRCDKGQVRHKLSNTRSTTSQPAQRLRWRLFLSAPPTWLSCSSRVLQMSFAKVAPIAADSRDRPTCGQPGPGPVRA